MPLYNASKRARTTGQLVNRNTGGGNKKAGFPYMIGRSYTTSIFLRSTDPIHGRCCKLTTIMPTMQPKVSISKPIGYTGNSSYWRIA